MSSGDPGSARFVAPFDQSDAAVQTRDGGAPGLPLSRCQLLALAASCGTGGMLGWALWLWVFYAEPAQDWMVFYTAAQAYFDGNLPLIFDGDALTPALNQRFAAWLAYPLNLHPWVYPPTFLLLFLPFGLLPPVASLAVFLLSGFIVLLAAASHYAGRGQSRWIVGFSLVLCPAVPFNVMTGQNAFFTSALLVGGFGLIGRYPVLGGTLLGILSFKPQLWLMVPVALLAARQWRAVGGAAASGLILAILSLLVFGPEIWRTWLALATGVDEAYRAWLTNGRLNGMSVFACVAWLGAPSATSVEELAGYLAGHRWLEMAARLAQWLAVAIAAAIVYRVFRRPGPGMLQLAALLGATMLAAPHASASDAVLLALATSLYVAAPRRAKLQPLQLVLAAAVWISPLFNPPSLFRPGSLTPLLVLLLLGAIIAETRRDAAPA